MVTNSWLEQVKEEIVDPERPIIDPHHHLWSDKEGASDYQIPAVACDTATDTVHVGTASGRSEFDGLLRINNTTDAISVAVSESKSESKQINF